jgi:hypothetical protein
MSASFGILVERISFRVELCVFLAMCHFGLGSRCIGKIVSWNINLNGYIYSRSYWLVDWIPVTE